MHGLGPQLRRAISGQLGEDDDDLFLKEDASQKAQVKKNSNDKTISTNSSESFIARSDEGKTLLSSYDLCKITESLWTDEELQANAIDSNRSRMYDLICFTSDKRRLAETGPLNNNLGQIF